MVGRSVFFSALAAASAVFAKTDHARSTIPAAFIFEFEEGMTYDAFRKEYQDDATLRRTIDQSLFKGVSIQFNNVYYAQEKADRLAALPGVKKMWPVGTNPVPNEVRMTGRAGSDFIDLRKRDDDDDEVNSALKMTQIDKLHENGYTGNGIRVAVIDTGIDYMHPALGGCFGEGCLVEYGHDFVGDDEENPEPDDDPMDCDGHGTHVAGIIAAQSNPLGFGGAAPGVTLGAYRVIEGCPATTADDDVIIEAFNMAYDDGSHIISASLGGTPNWSGSVLAEAIDRICSKNVTCAIAAGNEGETGMFTHNDPATAVSANSVATFENIHRPMIVNEATYTIDGGDNVTFTYVAGDPVNWGNQTLKVYATSWDTERPDDACDRLPDDTIDLTDYVVLIRRGTCEYFVKMLNAMDYGAQAFMFYDNGNGVEMVEGSAEDMVGVGMMDEDTAIELVEALADDLEVEFSLPDGPQANQKVVVGEGAEHAGFPDHMTSWGPTWEMNLKPNFAGVGGSILSTYPLAKGSYAVFSGTSMATPQVAGAIALIMEARGIMDPSHIQQLLASTATQSPYFHAKDKKILAPVPQQGAGLIQAYDAVYVDAVPSVTGLSFNDTENFIEKKSFWISNTGKKDITFKFKHRPAGTAYMHAEGSQSPMPYPNDVVTDYAKISLDCDDKFTIKAGGQKKITAEVEGPKNVTESRLPMWSGYLQFDGDDGKVVSIPYVGAAAKMRSFPVLGNDTSLSLMDEGIPVGSVDPDETVMLPHPNSTIWESEELIGIFLNPSFGSRKILIEVIPVGDFIDEELLSDSMGVKTLGNIVDSPLEWMGRGSAEGQLFFDGQMADDEFIPPGSYQLLIRALRVNGDEKKKSDWDVSKTKPFKFDYKDEDEYEEGELRDLEEWAKEVEKEESEKEQRDISSKRKHRGSHKSLIQ